MGLNLEQKQAVVSEIVAQLGKAQAVIVAEYRGLDVGAVTDLRAKARKSGGHKLREREQRDHKDAKPAEQVLHVFGHAPPFL